MKTFPQTKTANRNFR